MSFIDDREEEVVLPAGEDDEREHWAGVSDEPRVTGGLASAYGVPRYEPREHSDVDGVAALYTIGSVPLPLCDVLAEVLAEVARQDATGDTEYDHQCPPEIFNAAFYIRSALAHRAALRLSKEGA
mgnify:CR=1 FL=1